MTGTSLYDGHADPAQSGQQAFSIFEAQLLGDGRQGIPFAEPAGDYFYIDRVDVPCDITFLTSTGLRTMAARDGLTFRGPFRGITLTYPLYAINVGVPLFRAIVAKAGVAENTLHRPTTRMPTSVQELPGNGVGGSMTFNIPVPDGYRYFNGDFFVAFTTAVAMVQTQMFLDLLFRNAAGGFITGPNVVDQNGQVYNATVPAGKYMFTSRVSNAAATSHMAQFEVRDLPIPMDTGQIFVVINEAIVGVANITWDVLSKARSYFA